jgi:flagellar biosynthesis/type III secretory pathway protein FliH
MRSPWGYVKGFTDGHTAGYQEAWKEANKMIANLQQRLADRESIGGYLQDIARGVTQALLIIAIN